MVYAYPKISRCGLGNMLLPWARAEIFCHEYNARMLKPQFVHRPSLGAILRRERYARLYNGNFDFSQGGYISGLKRHLLLLTRMKIDEFELRKLRDGAVVVFEGLRGEFSQILKSHQLVVDRLMAITHPKILADIRKLKDGGPYIGVHIRRGDFKLAGVMTDDEWYVRAIAKAIEIVGDKLPIRIFSDGHPYQLEFVRKAFPKSNVVIMPDAKPLHDIWALSYSAVMVGSSRSSFSIWAVLLGQMPSIWARQNALPTESLYKDGNSTHIIMD